jgi:hypothetical protein
MDQKTVSPLPAEAVERVKRVVERKQAERLSNYRMWVRVPQGMVPQVEALMKRTGATREVVLLTALTNLLGSAN